MKRNSIIFVAALFIFGVCAPARAALSLSIGMMWPQELLNTGIPSGDAGLLFGPSFDKKFMFGFAGDFLWNVRIHETQDTSNPGLYKVTSDQKTFMFPLMGFFLIDPVPNFVIHPSVFFSIGYNSMIYNVKNDSSYNTGSTRQSTPVSPYFYGLIIKTGAFANYSLGETSALFIGVEYQWADTKTGDTKNGLFNKRDMSGVGLKAGFRVQM